jgi:hypothetical protein
MSVNEGGIAAASFSLVVVIIRSLRDNHLATKQEIIDPVRCRPAHHRKFSVCIPH